MEESDAAGSIVPSRKDEIVDAVLGLRVDRYDLQIVMLNFETYRAEEVYSLSNHSANEIRLVALPPRTAELQLNMKARDGSGSNLVILTRAQEEALYRECLTDAVRGLRRLSSLPAPLKRLVHVTTWPDDLFSGAWIGGLSSAEAIEVTEYFQTLIDGFGDEISREQVAILVLNVFVAAKMNSSYSPLVQLSTTLRANEAGVSDKCLIKYVVHGRSPQSTAFRVMQGLFGWSHYLIPLRVNEEGSAHIRVTPPEGTVFDRPLSIPKEVTADSLDRSHLQVYVSERATDELIARIREHPESAEESTVVKIRISQSASVRSVTAVLFLATALLPPLLSGLYLVEQGLPLGLSDAVVGVSSDHIVDASTLSIPLAVALFASAWNQSAVRAFAVTQIGVAVMLVGLWVLGGYVYIARLAAISIGAVLGTYNLIEGASAMSSLNSVERSQGYDS